MDRRQTMITIAAVVALVVIFVVATIVLSGPQLFAHPTTIQPAP